MITSRICLVSCFSVVILLFSIGARAETQLIFDPKKTGATIHKNIYSQFMEHLGRGIYEGVWVGEDSDIPNTKGYRNDVLAALKELQVPLLRWPGGCFADEYHWRNGIGPRDKRPVTVNTSWGGVTDDNAFGTHEFFEFAELLDAEVYINGNLGTGTPQEMAEWLEYMTSPSQSTLANLRRQNGRDEPWKVHYFAIGNESWGCGGTMTPEYYANLYKHYATFMKTPDDNKPIFIASGGHTEMTEWTQTLLEEVPKTWSLKMDAISHHYYTLPTGDWAKKGHALGFDESQWWSTFANTLKLEEYIKANLAVMDKLDPENTVGFYVDEWGTWYDTPEGENPGFLYQQNSLRDALVAAVNLNMFHQYAERIQMTNIAQMVNVLQAMILTDREKMVLTPTYHIFKMYIPFQNATLVPSTLQYNPILNKGGAKIPQLSASVAKTEDGKLVLALANMDLDKTASVRVPGDWKEATGQVLTAKKMDAHNTFKKGNRVTPKSYQARAKKSAGLTLKIPAKAVVVVELK